MAEKKKTEITVLFEVHEPSIVEKKLPYLRSADIILYEDSPTRVKEILEGRLVEFDKPLFPEFSHKDAAAVRKLSREGKVILGTDLVKDPQWRLANKRKASKYRRFGRAMFKAAEKRDSKRYAKALARQNKMREEEQLKWIKENLPKFEGKKICVVAGAAHTWLYHQLKRELGPKGVIVKAEHLSKLPYMPDVQLARAYRFGVANRKLVKRLVLEDKRLEKVYDKLFARHSKPYLTEEEVHEKIRPLLLKDMVEHMGKTKPKPRFFRKR